MGLAVGYGARTRIRAQINNLGTNMIVITPEGHENMSGFAPIEIDAIEKATGGGEAAQVDIVVDSHVVGVEKPLGSRCRNSSKYSRRAHRKPDVRSGIGCSVR